MEHTLELSTDWKKHSKEGQPNIAMLSISTITQYTRLINVHCLGVLMYHMGESYVCDFLTYYDANVQH